jgi:hypothetical protein
VAARVLPTMIPPTPILVRISDMVYRWKLYDI